jgi:hypothetical protein
VESDAKGPKELTTADAWALVTTVRTTVGVPAEARFAAEMTGRLATLTPDEILEFQRFFNTQMARAQLAGLYNAAYLINGVAADEAFEHFRAWLIAQGEECFEAARVNPDRLVNLGAKKKSAKLEELMFSAATAYNVRTGKTDFYDKLSPNETALEGTVFRDDAELKRTLPLLFAKYRG